ncbi:hypothetical protein BIW11_04109 [Tropilaelaps mercedesae]|uniref:Uncharacterized protein n=1 Tax=Tropilaelaps mercedesae TaxID=418985 RepID=A0A1V9XBJ5_9ACAR|nr:hypothetical protein BIW11_04109 [Tropilaelaps mercedesae]
MEVTPSGPQMCRTSEINGNLPSVNPNGTIGYQAHQISGLQGIQCQGPLVVSLPARVSQRVPSAKERPPRSIPVVKVAQPIRQSWTQARGSKKEPHHHHRQLANGISNNTSASVASHKERTQLKAVSIQQPTHAHAVESQSTAIGVVQRMKPLHVHVGNSQPGEETQSEIFWDF